MPPFCPRILSKIMYCIYSSCPLWFLAVTVSQTSVALYTLIILRNVSHVFYRMYLSWDMSDDLLTKLGLWVLGRKATEVKYHFHHIMSKGPAINMTYHHYCRLRSCLPGFSAGTCFFLFPVSVLYSGIKSLYSAQNEEWCFIYSRGSIYINILDSSTWEN